MLRLLDVHVLPQRNADPGNQVKARSGDEHVALRLAVAEVDRIAGRAADGVRALGDKVAVDGCEVVEGFGGQVRHEAGGEDAGPDGAGDGRADGGADGDDHGLGGEQGGVVLLLGDRHEGRLLRNHEDAAAKGNEDEAHDDVADVDVWLAEVDHQADAEDGERDSQDEGVHLEFSVVAEGNAVDQTAGAGAHGVCVVDVTGVKDGLVEHNDEHGVEVRVPDIPGGIQGEGHGVREDNGAVFEQVPGHERDWRAILLPQAERDNQEEPEDDEADDHGRLPCVFLETVEVEGQKEERETGGKDQQTDYVELNDVVFECLEEAATAGFLRDETLSASLPVVLGEEPDERRGNDRDDDCKHAESPLESHTIDSEDAGHCRGVHPCGDEPRRSDEAEEEGSVPKLGSVGDEDGDGEVNHVVAGRPERHGRAVRLDVFAARHHDQTHNAADDTDDESNWPTPNVHDLGVRELPDTSYETCDDAGQRSQRMGFERRCDVRR